MDGKSISGARWSLDGKSVFFLQGGKLWEAPFKGGKLGKRTLRADVPGGIDDYLLSPDQSQMIYVKGVHSHVEVPSDTDPALDKAKAYATEDLMYRHWDHWRTEIAHSFVAPLVNGVVTEGMDILGEEEQLFELPNGPFSDIADLCWSPDGRFIAYACKLSYNNRQNAEIVADSAIMATMDVICNNEVMVPNPRGCVKSFIRGYLRENRKFSADGQDPDRLS